MKISELESKQPVVYKTLSNAIKRKSIAHTFLFAGSKNRLKLETAFLLSATIIEDGDCFSDESSPVLKRIKSFDYTDFYFIDGEKESIKKDDIVKLKESLSLTGLEGSGKKVYVINNINNSSPKVLNMLLKFMEEPSSSDIFAILISDNAEDLLETIVSRAFRLTFSEESRFDLFKIYEKKGMNQYDCYVLSNIIKEPDLFKQNSYVNAIHLKDSLLKNSENYDDFLFYLHNTYFDNLKETGERKDLFVSLDYFINIMKLLINDCLSRKTVNTEYDSDLKLLENSSFEMFELLECFTEFRGKLETRYDTRLLLDELSFKINKCRK